MPASSSMDSGNAGLRKERDFDAEDEPIDDDDNRKEEAVEEEEEEEEEEEDNEAWALAKSAADEEGIEAEVDEVDVEEVEEE